MGWLFGWDSRRELISHLTKDEVSGDWARHTVAKYLSGNTMWSVVEVTKEGATKRYIGCDLLRRSGGDWGYKDLCESMGPCEVSCPPKFLDMAPVENAEWRAGVLEYWRKKREGAALAKELTRGQKFKSRRSGDVFEFCYSEGRGGTVIGRLLEPAVWQGTMRSRKASVGECFRVRKQDVELVEAGQVVATGEAT